MYMQIEYGTVWFLVVTIILKRVRKIGSEIIQDSHVTIWIVDLALSELQWSSACTYLGQVLSFHYTLGCGYNLPFKIVHSREQGQMIIPHLNRVE